MFLLLAASSPSLSAQPATNALPVLAPPYGEIPPPFWQQYGIMIWAGGAALFVVAGLILWKLLQPKPAVVLPPETVAREALTKLLHRPENGQVLSEVSQILRRYVGAVSGFCGGELTTSEFSTAMTANSNVSPQIATTLATFLHACDRDKYAAKNEAPPLNAVQRAVQFVEQIERQRAESKSPQSKPR
ncbi:MAG TPA: hypothetical protein VFY06_12805 [Verrucomicrobiae bacterium]|nr:hypothetical protein [Verrucomicrobiae bacterium]